MNRTFFRLFTYGLFFLCSVFIFWFALLPFSLKSIVRSKTGSELIFRNLSLQGRDLVLKDALFLDLAHERSLRVREVRITIVGLFKTKILLLQPHLVVCEGVDPLRLKFKNSIRKRSSSIKIIEGTYEWGKKKPLFGRFSYEPEKGLLMEGGGGELKARVTSEGEIACSLNRWNAVQFLNQNICSEVKGVVSGDLLFSKKGILGQLTCEEFAAVFSEKKAEVAADFLEWKSTGDFDRGKILIRGAVVSVEGNKLDQLSGSCFYSRILGFFWKISNSSFFCDGSLDWESGEWKTNCSGTSLIFQGMGWNARCEGCALFLRGKWLQQEECSASFSFFGGSGGVGVVAFSDLQAEGQIEKGSFSASTLTGTVNGIGVKGCIEGSLTDPAVRMQLSGASPHLECQGSLLVQTELSPRIVKVETNFSHFLIRRDEGEIVFSEMENGCAIYEKGEWRVDLPKNRGECFLREFKIPFDGSFSVKDSLLAFEGKSWFRGIESKGRWMFALQDEIPFSFQAELLEGNLEFLSAKGHLSSSEFLLNGALLQDPSLWKWKMEGEVSNAEWKFLSQGSAFVCADSQKGLTSCRNLSGVFEFGSFQFPLRGVELSSFGGKWFFDFRFEPAVGAPVPFSEGGALQNRFYDLLRLKGEVEKEGNHLALQFDREATRLLDVPLAIQKCLFSSQGTLEKLELDLQIPWATLSTLIPQIEGAREFILESPFSEVRANEELLPPSVEELLLQTKGEDFPSVKDLECLRHSPNQKNVCLGQLLKEQESDKQPVHTLLKVEHLEKGWEISHLQIGKLFLAGIFNKKEGVWTAEQGVVRKGETDSFTFCGKFDFSSAEFVIDALSVDLHNLALPISVEGRVEGSGSVEWKGGSALEADFNLQAASLIVDSWVFENRKEIQVHCSQKQGLLVQGLDFNLCKGSAYCLEGKVALLQFDFQNRKWVFDHTHVQAPSASLQGLLALIPARSPFSFLLNVFSPHCDLEISSSFEFAANGSSFSCLLLEGLIPLFDEVRQVKNVELQWNAQRLSGCFQLRHSGGSFNGGMLFQIKPFPCGRFFLESLNIEWEIDPKEGFVIHSIDGSCGGFEASFYKERESKNLLGSLWCQFDQCVDFFPSEIGRMIRKLKIGKGYELKGRFSYENGFSFNGVLSGKACELLGYQIRTLFTHVDLDTTQLRLSEINVSDSAGVLNIDSLTIKKDLVAMPSLLLRDFRPSLLQKLGQSENLIAPFVIRDLKLSDFKGNLKSSSSFTAHGQLTFVNSFKQGRTVLDLPADLLGRIVGLDLELLIPVQGTLKLELKDRRFWMSDLCDSWSEGKRSQFFLVNEGLSPSIDLEGNLNILVKMKQYVLFKITENFLLSIEGTLQNPDYHLQKKKKSLG